MKNKLIITVALGLSAGFVISQTVLDFPSQRISKPERFLLVSRDDMRLFLCGHTELANRTSRGVCLVENIHPKGAPDPRFILEIPVPSGMSLTAVLAKAGMDKGAQQVRIFSQNSIR